MKTQAKKTEQQPMQVTERELRADLRLARLLAEKCELTEARALLERTVGRAKKAEFWEVSYEALCVLLMVVGESAETDSLKQVARELDELKILAPEAASPSAWYCRAAASNAMGNFDAALDSLRRYRRELRKLTEEQRARRYDPEDGFYRSYEEEFARAWVMIASLQLVRGRGELCLQLLGRLERQVRPAMMLGAAPGIAQLVRAYYFEKKGDLEQAWHFATLADHSFLSQHHWYYHLHCLEIFARLLRLQGRGKEAKWYLGLLDEATRNGSFGKLRTRMKEELRLLDEGSIDVTIDSDRGVIRTREGDEIRVGKQFILMGMLETLYHAHLKHESSGVSKAEMIQSVWKEDYLPAAHDNKLYYNVNRLRKLIEKDASKPKYLLNSKDGYRFAPGLNIRMVRAERRQEGEWKENGRRLES